MQVNDSCLSFYSRWKRTVSLLQTGYSRHNGRIICAQTALNFTLQIISNIIGLNLSVNYYFFLDVCFLFTERTLSAAVASHFVNTFVWRDCTLLAGEYSHTAVTSHNNYLPRADATARDKKIWKEKDKIHCTLFSYTSVATYLHTIAICFILQKPQTHVNKVDQSGLVAVVALPLILINLRCQFLLRVLMTRKCFKMYRAVVFALWAVILVVTLPSDSHCLCLDLQNLLILRWLFILYSARRCHAIFNPSGSWLCWS